MLRLLGGLLQLLFGTLGWMGLFVMHYALRLRWPQRPFRQLRAWLARLLLEPTYMRRPSWPAFGRAALRIAPFALMLGLIPLACNYSNYHALYERPEGCARLQIQNLNMPGKVGKYQVITDGTTDAVMAKITYGLRFEAITREVEQRYDLPPHSLLALLIQESSGSLELSLNALNDGGAGICTMQPSIATSLGLKTLDGVKVLRSTEHGMRLREMAEQNDYDLRELARYDERLNPVLNIDAAGRLLRRYMEKYERSSMSDLEVAVLYYAGKYNYPKYIRNLRMYREKLADTAYRRRVAQNFNRLNPRLKVNGQANATYRDYLRAFTHYWKCFDRKEMLSYPKLTELGWPAQERGRQASLANGAGFGNAVLPVR
jgi:hypothetical protein